MFALTAETMYFGRSNLFRPVRPFRPKLRFWLKLRLFGGTCFGFGISAKILFRLTTTLCTLPTFKQKQQTECATANDTRSSHHLLRLCSLFQSTHTLRSESVHVPTDASLFSIGTLQGFSTQVTISRPHLSSIYMEQSRNPSTW